MLALICQPGYGYVCECASVLIICSFNLQYPLVQVLELNGKLYKLAQINALSLPTAVSSHYSIHTTVLSKETNQLSNRKY